MSAGNTGRYGAVLHETQPKLPPSEPPIERDAEVTSNAEAAGRVTLAHGRFRVSMPAAVVLAALTCAGGYFASAARKPPDDPSALLEAFRAERATDKGERAEELKALNHRLDVLETNLSLARASVDAVSVRVTDLRADLRAGR
jgi:hypothetical protein